MKKIGIKIAELAPVQIKEAKAQLNVIKTRA